MTEGRLPLSELLEKAGDGDFLRSVAEAVKAPGVSQRLLGLGAAPIGSMSDDFAALIRAEHAKWGPVIKAAGIRGE